MNEYTLLGLPVRETDTIPDGEMVLFNPSVFAESVTSALIRGIMESKIRYGKAPQKIILTREQADLLAEEFRKNSAGIINETPEGAPKQPMFMGIPVELKKE